MQGFRRLRKMLVYNEEMLAFLESFLKTATRDTTTSSTRLFKLLQVQLELEVAYYVNSSSGLLFCTTSSTNKQDSDVPT